MIAAHFELGNVQSIKNNFKIILKSLGICVFKQLKIMFVHRLSLVPVNH